MTPHVARPTDRAALSPTSPHAGRLARASTSPAALRAGALAGLLVPLPVIAAAVITIAHAANIRQNGFPWAAAAAAVSAAACTLALTGVHARQWRAPERAVGLITVGGLLGVAGFFVALGLEDLIATVFDTPRFLSDNDVVTGVGTLTASLLSIVVVPLGWILVGVAALRARVLAPTARVATVLLTPLLIAGVITSAAFDSTTAAAAWLALFSACWCLIGRDILHHLDDRPTTR